MLRMLVTTRSLLAAAALAAAATSAGSALAADGLAVDARFGIGQIGGWAERARAEAKAAAAEGPFAPVVGELDFGTAENAFGAARSGHVHAGQDLFAAAGTALVAVSNGVIADAGSDGGQGNFVHLYDPERERTYIYMHMLEPAGLSAGDRVLAGDRLGGVGCSGSCWGEHLHFEIRAGRGMTGEARDPLPVLRDWERLERPR